jgi:hypothetical protein
MRIQILSDLHHEHLRHALAQGTPPARLPWQGRIPPGSGDLAGDPLGDRAVGLAVDPAAVDVAADPAAADVAADAAADAAADVVVLAGDIDVGTAGIVWAGAESQRLGLPVVYVAGNHEFYGSDLPRLLDRLREEARHQGVYFLDNDVVSLGGVRFLGCTLWTDYRHHPGIPRARLLATIARVLTDHRLIRLGGRPFLPEDAAQLHAISRAWLAARLAEPHPGPTVVVTHHGPSPLCQHPRIPAGFLSAAFHSDLTALLGAGPAAWIYGHTHANLCLDLGGTWLLSNQAGYPGEAVPGFAPGRLLQLPGAVPGL